MVWSEDRLHRWLRERLAPSSRLRVGSVGHDAAVLRPGEGREVVCVDQTIEAVHFDPSAAPRAVGRKAVGRALSDLAATAARPRAVLAALTAPAEAKEPWLRGVLRAIADRARDFGAELVGGDLACAPGPRTVSVTALGHLTGRRRAPGRDRAHPGQHVLLSGPVGGSLLGRHLEIEPRVDLGRWLHEQGATAMMDVSDGLALDLARIARLSNVRIDLEEVPIHPDARRLARRTCRSPLDHALNDGEDHELLATVPAASVKKLLAVARRRFPALRVVGRVRRGKGLWVDRGEDLAPWDGKGGWLHGT